MQKKKFIFKTSLSESTINQPTNQPVIYLKIYIVALGDKNELFMMSISSMSINTFQKVPFFAVFL